MKAPRARLTYANVVSTICLFLVLGGGAAFAAGGLAPNSVGSAQLKKNAVTTAKIKKGAVTGGKIKISTLPTVPFAGHAAIAVSSETAVRAGSAKEATRAATADTATNADKLGGSPPSAYALASSATRSATINAAGTVLRGQGITQANVTRVAGAATYCINGLETAPSAAIAQITFSQESGATALAETDYLGCQAYVATYEKSGGSKGFQFTVILR